MPQGPVFKGLFSLPFITHMAVAGCVAVALANPTFGQEIPAENAASQPNIGGEVLLPETQQDTQTNTGTSETVRGPDSPPPEITDETRRFATDIASNQAAIDISAALAVSRVSDPAEPGAAWFTVYIENTGNKLGTRVLHAFDPPIAVLSISPPHRRPTPLEVAGSDGAVIIERAAAYGANTFRIIVPPAHESALALHFDGVGPAPTLFAWTESALIAHNRQI